jgi:hypothetical protein
VGKEVDEFFFLFKEREYGVALAAIRHAFL